MPFLEPAQRAGLFGLDRHKEPAYLAAGCVGHHEAGRLLYARSVQPDHVRVAHARERTHLAAHGLARVRVRVRVHFRDRANARASFRVRVRATGYGYGYSYTTTAGTLAHRVVQRAPGRVGHHEAGRLLYARSVQPNHVRGTRASARTSRRTAWVMERSAASLVLRWSPLRCFLIATGSPCKRWG